MGSPTHEAPCKGCASYQRLPFILEVRPFPQLPKYGSGLFVCVICTYIHIIYSIKSNKLSITCTKELTCNTSKFKKSTIPKETRILSIHKNRMLMRQFYKNRVLMRAYYSSLAIWSRITIRNQIIFKNLFSIRKRSRSMNNKFKSRIRSFRGRTKKYQSYRFFLISNGWKFKL